LAAHLGSFAQAQATLALLTGVAVGESTLERGAVSAGTALRQAQREQAQQHQQGRLPQPAHKPQRLYLSFDGMMTPLRDLWKRDGSHGALICRFGECKMATVYEARPGPQGDEGVVRRTYLATMGDVQAFTPLAGALAHQCGHHWARELVVLADGAAWIWLMAAGQFPTAIQILDFFHASQHLWKVAHACCPDDPAAAKEWVSARQAELKADQLDPVLAAIAAWEPRNEEVAKLQATEHQFFVQNRERLRYGTFLAQGYQIGSGVMEAACKQVVGSRLDQAGMHWSQATAEAIVTLRAALLSTHPPDLRPYLAMPT
jgi:hypothetical protein